ncbi:tyrosine-type recombinase/integrase [Methylobacterium sp. CM6247]
MGRKVERRSLRTLDRAEAEILAVPIIAQYRLDLWEHQNRRKKRFFVESVDTIYPIGESTLPDGTEVVATRLSAYLMRLGEPAEKVDNYRLNLTPRFDHDEANRREAAPPKAQGGDADLPILEAYLALKKRNAYYAKEARDTWALFGRLVDGKAMKDCTREDGRKLVAHLQERGDKSATIVKKLNYLGAAVNYAIGEGLLTSNPFAKIAPQIHDASRRVPYDDEEMAKVALALPGFDPQSRLLWLLLASTGMRLGEAFHINSEKIEKGIRYVEIGSKNAQSRRRLPLPDAVLPLLPEKITGQLFKSNSKNLGRVLQRLVRKAGADGEGKVLHSLRHRAKDRMRAEGCPVEVQYELFGHEEKTVAAGYGHGSPMTVLKPWIDKIIREGA